MTEYRGKPLPSMTGGELDRRCARVEKDLAAIGQMAAVSVVISSVLGPAGLPLAVAANCAIGQRRASQGGPTHLRGSE